MFILAALLAFGSSQRGLRLAVLLYTVVGVCGSIGFIYLDLAFIRAFCIYCLISAIITILTASLRNCILQGPAGGNKLAANAEGVKMNSL